MNNKKVGVLIVILALILGGFLYFFRQQYVELQLSKVSTGPKGECIHPSGETCPYEQINQVAFPTIIATAVIVLLGLLGIYLVFFEKSRVKLEEKHEEIIQTLAETKKKETEEEHFNILLQGLDDYEKKVLQAVKEQDGIGQNTLRLRTELSKTKLSMVLSQMEKKGLIAKIKKGKINEVFLKRKM